MSLRSYDIITRAEVTTRVDCTYATWMQDAGKRSVKALAKQFHRAKSMCRGWQITAYPSSYSRQYCTPLLSLSSLPSSSFFIRASLRRGFGSKKTKKKKTLNYAAVSSNQLLSPSCAIFSRAKMRNLPFFWFDAGQRYAYGRRIKILSVSKCTKTTTVNDAVLLVNTRYYKSVYFYVFNSLSGEIS